ncbi:MAG: gliding motility-associated C-terminal domain-containing protein [Bacteroidota bacterium]
MKTFLLVSFLCLVTLTCSAQRITPSVINAGGGSFTNSAYVFEWNIGELALVESMVTSKVSLTNGFLQPLPPLFIVTPNLYVVATNILTPNADGSNDTWIIRDLDRYSENEVTIIDRGGRILFKVKNYQNDWKGDFNGNPLAEDTYYYILSLKKNNQTAIQRGFITLIR